MADHIDFYFEFSSPYGYFASTQIEALAADLQRSIKWHPILLGPMFKATGSMPLVDIPVKGQYSLHDMERTARLFNIPFKQPSPFPIGTVSAARAVLYVQQKHPEQTARLVRSLYEAYFVKGLDISQQDITLAVCEEAGLPAAEVQEGIAQDEIKALLKQEINNAMERGVFGSPFMIVDDEPFWGFDRFDHIRRWLQQK